MLLIKNETKRASNLFYCLLNEMLTETLFIYFFSSFLEWKLMFCSVDSLEFKREHINYCIKFFVHIFVFHNYKSFLKRALIWSALVLFKIDTYSLLQCQRICIEDIFFSRFNQKNNFNENMCNLLLLFAIGSFFFHSKSQMEFWKC